jgi:glutamyl/glutaminyl-tRNA synthetase
MPMLTGSVDRLEQMPDRVRMIFSCDPAAALALAEVQAEMAAPDARAVVTAFAAELAGAPPLDRESFRAVAARVKQATGQKGKGLFHPIRVALTGEVGGPELDLLVPAIEQGATLPPEAGVAPILSCRERAARFAAALAS